MCGLASGVWHHDRNLQCCDYCRVVRCTADVAVEALQTLRQLFTSADACMGMLSGAGVTSIFAVMAAHPEHVAVSQAGTWAVKGWLPLGTVPRFVVCSSSAVVTWCITARQMPPPPAHTHIPVNRHLSPSRVRYVSLLTFAVQRSRCCSC